MTEVRPALAETYELTPRELRINGELFPYYLHEDEPRIEPTFDGELTTLWVPVLINAPCPKLGSPDGHTPPVQG